MLLSTHGTASLAGGKQYSRTVTCHVQRATGIGMRCRMNLADVTDTADDMYQAAVRSTVTALLRKRRAVNALLCMAFAPGGSLDWRAATTRSSLIFLSAFHY